ncbi:hypothetical protein JW906_11160, partial [bacterium]|nr:hypothetical protein [bacterium]
MISDRKIFLISVPAVLTAAVLSSCRAGSGDSQHQDRIRPPAVAGAFYPGSRAQLEAQIRTFLKNAEKTEIQG